MQGFDQVYFDQPVFAGAVSGGLSRRIKLAGNDITLATEEASVIIQAAISKRIDVAQLRYDTVRAAFAAGDKQELIICNNHDTVRYFAGYVANVGVGREGITKMHELAAQDYTVLLDTAIVNEIYEDQTGLQIVQDAFTTYLPEIDSTAFVLADGITYDSLVFNRVTLRKLMDDLARNAGFDWYIDYYKNLHYFSQEENPAPYELSDTPDNSTTFPYSQLKYKRDGTSVINRVTVVGGTYLSADTDFELPGDAQLTEFDLPYKLHKPEGETGILVYKNTGTDGTPIWTAQTVGTDYIDTLPAKDVLYNYQEKLLKFDTAPADLKRSIKVTGQYDIPILVRVRSWLSYGTYANRWYDSKIVNSDINSRAWAQRVGKAELAEKAFVIERIGCLCEEDGLYVGQLIRLVNTITGIDGYYIINTLITRPLGGTNYIYQVLLGQYNPDLIDMLVALKNDAMQYQGKREDEVLLDLLEETDTLGLNDATSRWEQLKGQYCWAPKTNGGGLREARWDFFTWG